MLNILRLVGLEQDGKKKVGKYSIGMKQRLGIAQAVLENQEILIQAEYHDCIHSSNMLHY